jgi:hypothetical protein
MGCKIIPLSCTKSTLTSTSSVLKSHNWKKRKNWKQRKNNLTFLWEEKCGCQNFLILQIIHHTDKFKSRGRFHKSWAQGVKC